MSKSDDENRRETTPQSRPLRVCFFCWAAYPLFNPESPTIFGGAEVRSASFARILARRPDFEVSFISADEGQKADEVRHGVRLLGDRTRVSFSDRLFWTAYQKYRMACDPLPSFPFVSLKKFQFGLLWQVPTLAIHRLAYLPWKLRSPLRPRSRDFYSRHGFDAFCCFHINEITADIVATCKTNGIRSVVFLICNDDVKPPLTKSELTPENLHRKAHSYVLANADLIVAQSEFQVEELRRNYGRSCVLIRNPIDLAAGVRPRDGGAGDFAFWIGRAQRPGLGIKRPELLLELARLCPKVPFVAIINADDPARHRQLVAEKPANLEIVEKVPFDQIDDYFRRTRIFLSTSGTEGFPNTFLQAGKHSVPILSLLVDPNGMLSQHGAGQSFDDDLPAMATTLTRLWSQPEELARMGQSGRRYAETFHDFDRSGNALADQLISLVRG